MTEHARGGSIPLSEITRALLYRQSGGECTVALSRNAKGVTQIEVTSRAETLGQAKDAAVAVYDSLRSMYPLPSGLVGAENTELETPFS